MSEQKRVVCLIDGFNLYHAIDDIPELHIYKWLDLNKLAKCFAKQSDKLVGTYFFTAVTEWSPEKTKRHRNYILALESKGIEVVHGRFHYSEVWCRYCNRKFKKFEEKQTDVNIAIKLLGMANADEFDTALIISGDSDLAPSINAVKKISPEKQIGVVVPIGRRAKHLQSITDFHHKIKRKHLESSLMESPVVLEDGDEIVSPYGNFDEQEDDIDNDSGK